MVKITTTQEGQILDIEGDAVEVVQTLFALRNISQQAVCDCKPRKTTKHKEPSVMKHSSEQSVNRMKFIWKKVTELKKKGMKHKQAFKKAAEEWKG